jgi:vancomycin resistance protein YoaR
MIQKTGKYLQALGVILIISFLSYPLIQALKYKIFYKHKVYPKVSVLDLNLEGYTKDQAASIIAKKINEANLDKIVLTNQDKSWELNLKKLNLVYLPEKTAEKAYSFGKNGNNLVEQWKLWQKGANFNLDYKIENNLLEQYTATIEAQLNIPVVPPTIDLVYNQTGEKQVQINPGKEGLKLNKQKLYKTLEENISQLNSQSISLTLNQLRTVDDSKKLAETKTRAENLLNKKVKLEFENNNWFLEDKEIINFLNFDSSFDDKKIASYTSQLAISINRPPQNALFNFNQGRVTEFKPAQDGQALNQEKTQKLLKEAFIGLEQKDNKLATVKLPVDLSRPQIATKDVNNFGIIQQIGKGESWFKGSIDSRIHNVGLAAKKLNGLLIPPDETFSFNQSLGDVSSQTGFQQAYIIKDGRTILGDGGGVCQVSTTLFRAVLDAGLPIEERQAHAYRVSYYEQNYQAGVDATVFSPHPDFVFKNDTPGHILIQTFMDTANYKLTFILYGTWDNRQSALSESRVWDQIPPPPDLYQDDPSLPAGTVKQVDWKSWGAKVAFDWKVVRGDQILQERTFYSHYKPWQAVFLKGTSDQ